MKKVFPHTGLDRARIDKDDRVMDGAKRSRSAELSSISSFQVRRQEGRERPRKKWRRRRSSSSIGQDVESGRKIVSIDSLRGIPFILYDVPTQGGAVTEKQTI